MLRRPKPDFTPSSQLKVEVLQPHYMFDPQHDCPKLVVHEQISEIAGEIMIMYFPSSNFKEIE